MLVDDEPLPVDLLENIGNAKREIERLSILVRPAGFEDAVSVREVPVGFRLPIADLGVKSARVSCQKAFPILSEGRRADILTGNQSIENE